MTGATKYEKKKVNISNKELKVWYRRTSICAGKRCKVKHVKRKKTKEEAWAEIEVIIKLCQGRDQRNENGF